MGRGGFYHPPRLTTGVARQQHRPPVMFGTSPFWASCLSALASLANPAHFESDAVSLEIAVARRLMSLALMGFAAPHFESGAVSLEIAPARRLMS